MNEEPCIDSLVVKHLTVVGNCHIRFIKKCSEFYAKFLVIFQILLPSLVHVDQLGLGLTVPLSCE